MANSGSIGLAVGAALIGLGAVFAAFLALRILSALIRSAGSALGLNTAKVVSQPLAPAPKPASRASQQPPAQGAVAVAASGQPTKPGDAPTGETIAAISVALAIHGKGDEVVAAIATAIALETGRGTKAAERHAPQNIWAQAGRNDLHGRRLAIQSRAGG